MSAPSPRVQAFMDKYSVDHDEVWLVTGGKSWAVKHSALERIAAENGITFELPQLAEKDGANKNVAMLVVGTMGDRREWSIGEASPLNYKTSDRMAAYPYAMAEKRGKDRVILKLLNSHGTIYSEWEIGNPDEPKRGIDNVPHAEPTEKLRVVDQRPIFKALQAELYAHTDAEEALAWMNTEETIDRVKNLKPDWQRDFRGLCKEHLASLRQPQTEAAE